MLRTIKQNNRLHALLGKLQVDKEEQEEIKQDLVFQFTNERTIHSRSMLYNECNNLIKHLELRFKGTPFTIHPHQVSAQKQRRKMFSFCHEMRWTIEGEVDKKRLFKWVKDYGYLHKPLMEYDHSELPTLVTQFEQVLKQFYAKR